MEKEATASMEAPATTKLSFSFSSSSSSKPSKPQSQTLASTKAAAGSDVREAVNGASKPQFVTEFDASQPLPLDAKPIIPPIPNADLNHTRRMKNLLPLPTSDDDPSAAEGGAGTRFVLDSSTGDAPASNTSYGLTLRTSGSDSAEKPQNVDDGLRRSRGRGGRGQAPSSGDEFMLQRFRDDMMNLAEDRGLDEFNDIKVEDFAAAVLKGYGWKEGQVIGRKPRKQNLEDTKIFEYKRKAGTEGIGYNPSSGDPTKKRGSWVAQGEKEKKDDELVRILSGLHRGSKALVLKKLGSSELLLKLLETREEITVGVDMVAKLGSPEEERFLRDLRKMDTKDQKGEDKRSDSKRREKKGSDVRESSGKIHKDKDSIVRWLTSHIRVRIISKSFKGGRLYLKKGQVIDVVGPTTCDVSMDDSGELVQGVHQEILETALPKRGGSVLVLFGKHKGVFGSLVERNTEDETGVVRDADSHALIKVRLEEIAEFTGDPSYLGY